MVNKNYEIYLITAPGYWYIGSASGRNTAQHRWNMHLSGRGKAVRLTEKMQELGSERFQQSVVERGYGDPIKAEQRWYDFYQTHDARQTLNGRRPSTWGSSLGRAHSIETKEKISQSLLGKSHSEERREKTRQARLGTTHSSETRAKMSASLKAHYAEKRTNA